jgi:hypothetical protein
MRLGPRQSSFAVSLICALVISCLITGNIAAQLKRPAPKPAAQTKTQAAQTGKQLTRDAKREPEPRLEPLPEDPAVANADVAITARVKARELRFDVVPNPKVEFPGQPARDTVWEAERENLPTSVQPGVTYRDIGIRLKITSVFSDIDKIVAEALGEVAITPDAINAASSAAAAPVTKPAVAPTISSPAPRAATSSPRPRGERN